MATAASAACLLAAGSVLGACGGSGGETQVSTPPPPAAQPEEFPKPGGKTLREMLAEYRAGPVIAASVSQFEPGINRFGFALFDRARAQIADAPVMIYLAPVGGGRVVGPIEARFERMEVKPVFQSRSVAADEDAAKSLYVADLRLPRPGSYELIGLAQLDGRLVAATPSGGPLEVSADGPVPEVGERAPVVNTDTRETVAGNIELLDTRQPASSMHDIDFADVVGRQPTVLLFATDALCQSRVCGPVIDVTEQVKSEREGDGVAFVHQEIYVDNDVAKGLRPSVAAWNLPTEPWLFVVGADGRIVERLEGAFSDNELNAAIDKAL